MDSVADGKVLVYPTKESHPDYIFIDKVCKLLKYMATQGQWFLITLERLLPVKPKMQVKGCRKMKVIVTMMKLSK
jgi:hypothetical protein